MYRVKMEVYFDFEGTNAEVVDAVRDFEMRNLMEFGDMNLVFDEPKVRKLSFDKPSMTMKPDWIYETLTEDCDVFNN